VIVSLLAYFFIRYRRRTPGQTAENAPSRHAPLQLISAFIVLVVLCDIFYLGLRGYLDMAITPVGAMPISVEAKKWNWSFVYPNGHVDGVLHVPVNRPVELQMKSSDINHSFFVPAFRRKMGIVPGRFTKAWFESNKPGEYLAFNTEYSGKDHSSMWARIVVHEPDGYEQWLNEVTDPFRTRTPVQVGELLYTKLACITCHSIDGTKKAGPSLKGLMGRQTQLVGGKSIIADENYVRDSINNPQAEVVEGFAPVMPKFEGLIKERELQALIEYLKTLQ
jgi:cytochrome c oxidase subunit 2